jgi:hypothetical protein
VVRAALRYMRALPYPRRRAAGCFPGSRCWWAPLARANRSGAIGTSDLVSLNLLRFAVELPSDARRVCLASLSILNRVVHSLVNFPRSARTAVVMWWITALTRRMLRVSGWDINQ